MQQTRPFSSPPDTPQHSQHPQHIEDGLYGKQALFGMIGIAMVVLLSALDQTIVSTALPQITADLRGFELYPWVATSYLLTSTVTIPVMGKMSDLYGRKYFLLISIVVFTSASAMAGLSQSMEMLIAARAVQGIGAGTFTATAFTSVGDMFPQPERRARWQGILTSTFGLASVVGPALGGVLTDAFGWRSVFYVNLPIGIVTVAVLWLTLPDNLSPRTPNARVDWIGALLIVTGASTLLLAVEWGGNVTHGLSLQLIALVLVSIVAFAAFFKVEQRAPEPLLPLDIFHERAVLLSSMLSAVLGFSLFGLIFYTPLFLQGVLGLSPSAAGLLQTPLVATMALGSLSSGQIYARTRRARILMVTGALFLISGSLLVSQASISTPHWILALELALCGAGVGMNFPMIMIIVQSSVPRHRLGVGTSTVQFSRMMGSVLGTAVVGSLVSGIFLSSLTASVSRTHPMLLQLVQDPQVLVDPLLRMDAYTTASQLGAVGVANLYYLLQTSRDALGWGVQSSYLLTSIISVTVLLLSWQLGKIYQEQQHQHPAHQQHGQTQHGIAH